MIRHALAVIAARGGSKRIPRKNIRPFLGKPVLQYSIEAALAANCFDEVIVSTDDDDIRDIALASGATVPFMRSEATSNDHASLEDVLLEVLTAYQGAGHQFETVCLLLPTAPFITAERLLQAHQQLLEDPALDAVLPVVRLGPIQRALTIRNDRLGMIWPEYRDARSNDLEPAYQDCGQFYWLRSEPFLSFKQIYLPQSSALIVPELEAQDIDTEEDWKIAEFKYQMRRNMAQLESG